jgi:hypothetical protein
MAAGAGTAALPKATVKIQLPAGGYPAGRPRVATPSSAPIKKAAQADSEQFYEEKDPEAGLVPLSVMCMVLGVVLLVVQMLSTDVVTSARESQPSAIMIPEVARVDWETQDPVTGLWRSNFDSMLPKIPE